MMKKIISLVVLLLVIQITIAQNKSYDPELHWPLIEWADQSWEMKNGKYNPGPKTPNYFSANNVFVDEEGIHLKITYENNTWYCAEIQTKEYAKYGTHTFEMILNPPMPVDHIDPNITIGTFFYEGETEKEFDVEFAAWGMENINSNTEFSIHSPYGESQTTLFGTHPTTNKFRSQIYWSSNEIIFRSFYAENDSIENSWVLTGEWHYYKDLKEEKVFNDKYIPKEEDHMKVHINFFLMNAKPPKNGDEAELIVTEYQFIPVAKN